MLRFIGTPLPRPLLPKKPLPARWLPASLPSSLHLPETAPDTRLVHPSVECLLTAPLAGLRKTLPANEAAARAHHLFRVKVYHYPLTSEAAQQLKSNRVVNAPKVASRMPLHSPPTAQAAITTLISGTAHLGVRHSSGPNAILFILIAIGSLSCRLPPPTTTPAAGQALHLRSPA